jgi:hypothetical protein
MGRLLLLIWLALAPKDDPLEAAREAFIKGDYARAITLARPLIATAPAAAWRVIGASYCFLHDKPGAMEAYRALEPSGQQFLKYVCARNSLTLP